MGKKAKTQITPDTYVKTDFRQVFATVFGPEEAEGAQQSGEEAEQAKKEAREKAIRSLSLEDQIGFAAYLGRRIQEFSDIFTVASDIIAEQPATAFAAENTLVSVSDAGSGELIGGLSIASETAITRSTANKKTRDLVLEEINKANLQGQFTKTTVELRNDALFSAKSAGLLPPSIGSLLTETETLKRTVKFKKL